jgi:hypothetical protein
MRKLKNWIVSSAKNLWGLNWEAKIGILFLIPPIIGVIIFMVELFDAGFDLKYFPEAWNCISDSSGWEHSSYGYAATPAIPLYLGLMAIAGAYLIKGNLKKKE